MSEIDLTAKARRAAEWFMANGWDVRRRDERWRAYPPGYATGDESALSEDFAGSDRLLIAFAEDRGWQDQEQEADGVEWGGIWGSLGPIAISVFRGRSGKFTYVLCDSHQTPIKECVEEAETFEEARSAAVEAARGMKRDGSASTVTGAEIRKAVAEYERGDSA